MKKLHSYLAALAALALTASAQDTGTNAPAPLLLLPPIALLPSTTNVSAPQFTPILVSPQVMIIAMSNLCAAAGITNPAINVTNMGSFSGAIVNDVNGKCIGWWFTPLLCTNQF